MAAKICTVCNIRRPKTGSKGTEISPHSDMCNYCFEEGGWENTHSDNNHDAILAEIEDKGEDVASFLSKHDAEELEFMSGCWICHPELNLAKLPAKAQTATAKVQGDRRPQLNHKGHSHPASPAARRACKAAFWAATSADLTDMNLQQAMDAWDAHLDGYGKPVAPVAKPATFTVVPRGPKGGVINQLKASKPKFLTKTEGKKLYGK